MTNDSTPAVPESERCANCDEPVPPGKPGLHLTWKRSTGDVYYQCRTKANSQVAQGASVAQMNRLRELQASEHGAAPAASEAPAAASKTPEGKMLSNLLARIHRDGGHYEYKHGTVKAVEDADVIVAKLYVVAAPAASEDPYAALSESVKGKPHTTDEPRIRHSHRSEGEASGAPADPEPRCKAHERQYPCHICNLAASEAPADGPVARHYHALGREMAADDLEVSPALERFREKAEAANAGKYCVSCGRSFGGPTITREQFDILCDRAHLYTSRFLRRTLAAAGITVQDEDNA